MWYEILYYLEEKRYYIIGFLILVIIIMIGICFYQREEKGEEENIVLEKKQEVKQEEDKIKVDIKGAIKNPGVYTLKQTGIVLDVVKAAGGFLESADTNYLNLSKKVKDEMVIIVYTKEEIQKMKDGDSNAVVIEGDCNCPEIQNDGCVDFNNVVTNREEKRKTGKVNLNSATIEELMTLSGIGTSKANAILSYRKTHGNFQNIEEIKNVKGIGTSIYEKIKDQITVS